MSVDGTITIDLDWPDGIDPDIATAAMGYLLNQVNGGHLINHCKDILQSDDEVSEEDMTLNIAILAHWWMLHTNSEQEGSEVVPPEQVFQIGTVESIE